MSRIMRFYYRTHGRQTHSKSLTLFFTTDYSALTAEQTTHAYQTHRQTGTYLDNGVVQSNVKMNRLDVYKVEGQRV